MSHDPALTTSHYTVSGMTCQHCVNAVTEEVTALPGVEAVHVDLDTGELTVTSRDELDRTDVAAAVDEAGYTLAAY
jgi:copper chaperone